MRLVLSLEHGMGLVTLELDLLIIEVWIHVVRDSLLIYHLWRNLWILELQVAQLTCLIVLLNWAGQVSVLILMTLFGLVEGKLVEEVELLFGVDGGCLQGGKLMLTYYRLT